MCDSSIEWDKPRTYIDPFGLSKTPSPPTPVPPPRAPTKTAEKVYGADSDSLSDEPQLLGTSALQIPLKTIQ